MKRSVFLYLLVTLVLISGEASAGNLHPQTGEKLSDNQVFSYSIYAEPPSIDPQLVEDVTGWEINNDLFEGLLTQDAEGRLVPGVAEHWETDASRTIYTFYLRSNAKWSNGDPVTASDFEYAWKRSVDPQLASQQAGYMALMGVKNASAIKQGKKQPADLGVKALQPNIFQVELESPVSYFPNMLTAATTMPVPRKVIQTYGDKWTKPGNMVGNGAYVLTEHVINERMVRERNPYYWDNEHTIIDKVIALSTSDTNQAYNRYQANELDKTDIPPGQFKKLQKSRPDETHSTPRLCSYFYFFNVEKPPFDDIRVRQALSYAIDREIITKNILGSGQTAAYTFTPQNTANFKTPLLEYANMSQPERVKKAKSLLQDAGFGAGNRLRASILYNTSEGHKKLAIAISQMWKKSLGIDVTLENQEWKTFLVSRTQGDFEIARAGWCGYYNEASAFLNTLVSDSEYNDANYQNPKLDRLMKQARSLKNPNPNYSLVEQIIETEFPIIPIYHYRSVFLLKSYVKGWPFHNIQNAWYSKNLYILDHQ